MNSVALYTTNFADDKLTKLNELEGLVKIIFAKMEITPSREWWGRLGTGIDGGR
jgi:hypothetical protein